VPLRKIAEDWGQVLHCHNSIWRICLSHAKLGTAIPNYDANRNLTSNGTFTFTYDSANRLITSTDGVTTYYISDEAVRVVP
jgi:hypothetical protein